MRISPWFQLTNRFLKSYSQRRHRAVTSQAGQVEQLEDKIMLSADMAAFFDLESTGNGQLPYTVSYPEVDELVTDSGTVFFDPLVEVQTFDDVSMIPGDGSFWNDVEAYNLEEVFKLHSNPGSNHTIYLDFDGHTTSGTDWNTFAGMDTIVSPAYDFDDNPQAFSEEELIEIIKIWARVAEDFAPFNVNVTTELPQDIEDLRKVNTVEGEIDQRWGVRVVIGDDGMNTGAGGIAFLNSFNSELDIPVFAFNGQNQFGSNVAAMTVSHEVGHALGLTHDGTSDLEYYRGHGNGATSWGPIMGAPFTTQVTQWSKGEYFDASNQQDDLTLITTNNGFGYYPDDYGDTFGSSFELIALGDTEPAEDLHGIIGRTEDTDFFRFWAGQGEIDFSVDVPSLGGGEPSMSNLDVLVGLYDQNGILLELFNNSGAVGTSFIYDLPASGLYYLQVTGVGFGVPQADPPTGYTDYGSLGNYRIRARVQPLDDTIVQIGDAVASEHEGTISFNVGINFAQQDDVLLQISTVDGTALAGRDYEAKTQTIRIPAGQTRAETTFDVSLINDLIAEPTETFTLVVQQVLAGDVDRFDDIGTGTILDNDDPLSLYLDIDKTSVREDAGPRAAKATVSRNGDLRDPLTVQLLNSDDSELYVPKTLTFPVGVDTIEVDIETVNDGAIDGTQAGITLTAVSQGYFSTPDSITVVDDDRSNYRTLGGHLYEPITPYGDYLVLLDIHVDEDRVLEIRGSNSVSTALKFAPGTGLYIEGAVLADASETRTITFRDQTERDNEVPPWAGIFYSAEGQQPTAFDNVSVTDAINGFTVYGTDTPDFLVTNSTVSGHVENGFVVTARNGDNIGEDEVKILNNLIYGNGEHGVLVSSFNTEFNISRSAPTIEGNTIHGHRQGAGVFLMANTSIVEITPEKAESIVAPRIFANDIQNNKTGIEGVSVRVLNDQNYTIVAPIAHNNLIANNTGNGIDLKVTTPLGLINADIINNTVVENGGIGLYHSNSVGDSFSVRNNIFAHNNGGGIVASGPFTPRIESIMRNLVWENGGNNWVNYPAQFGTMTELNVNRTPSDPEKNISGDPHFVNDGSFKIMPDSIAKNAGTRSDDDSQFGGYEGVEAPRIDFFGNARDFLRDIGYHEVSEGGFPFSEDFNDGAAQFFVPTNPNDWTVDLQGGNYSYLANTVGTGNVAVSVFGFNQLPQDFDISVEMTAVTGPNRWYDGFIVFDYKSPTDFKYAGMFTGQNQWVVGHYQGQFGQRYVNVDWDNSGRKINADQKYL
ncbi:MAG: hypothetical protein CMJ46_00105, partial [Planctomyces sp.]|nr:hypothetical protein [Planctomyces sp.]